VEYPVEPTTPLSIVIFKETVTSSDGAWEIDKDIPENQVDMCALCIKGYETVKILQQDVWTVILAAIILSKGSTAPPFRADVKQ